MYKPRKRRIKRYPRVAPPFRYLLTPKEASLALGVSRLTLQRWTKSYFEGRPRGGVEPVVLARRKDGTPSIVRFRWDSVMRLPEGTWLDEFLAQAKENREAEQPSQHPHIQENAHV